MQKNVNQSKTEDFRNDLCNAARQKKCFGFRVCVELTDTQYNDIIIRLHKNNIGLLKYMSQFLIS